jgi:iron(III) transport system substrate-binding protein
MSALAESAREEGRVSVYAPPGNVRPILVDAFNEEYPDIDVELWSAGTNPSALPSKLKAESAAGKVAADVVINGYSSISDLDMFAPLPEMVVLEEAKDDDLWTTDGLKFQGPNDEYLVLQYDLGNLLLVNTDSPDVAGLDSYEDLLKPEWKGKVVIGDPNLNRQALYAYDALYNKYGEEFFEGLAANEPLVVADAGQLVQMVGQGTHPVGIGAGSTVVAEFQKKGAPIEGLVIDDYSYVSAGYWVGAMPDEAPRPCAAQLYINWLLTPGAQEALAETLEHAPLREDVPVPDGVRPMPDDVSDLVDPGGEGSQAFNEEVTEAFYKYIDGPGKTK